MPVSERVPPVTFLRETSGGTKLKIKVTAPPVDAAVNNSFYGLAIGFTVKVMAFALRPVSGGALMHLVKALNL